MTSKISSFKPGQYVTWPGDYGLTLVGKIWFHSDDVTFVKVITLELGCNPETVCLSHEFLVCPWDGDPVLESIPENHFFEKNK